MASKNNKTAIILAGGLSKRMGFNKEFLKIDNQYLIFKQIKQLKTLFDEIIVVSNNKTFYKDQQVTVVQDIIQKKSPLVGLHAGLTYSSNQTNYLIACDMPNIDVNFISFLLDSTKGNEARIVSKNRYYEPFNALYSKSILPKLERFLEINLKFQDFIKVLDKEIIEDTSKFSENMFDNLNSKEDLDKTIIDPKTVQKFEVIKRTDIDDKNFTDYVIKEYPITLFINDEKYITMLITPTNIKELIIGYLKSEKIIQTQEDIESLTINESDFIGNVHLISKDELPSSNKDKLLTSGCGVGTRFHDDIDNILLESIDSDFTISYDEIIKVTNELNNRSGLFKLTGGVHSCLYVYDAQDIYVEDIGRHNAVDKIVGFIELHNINTKNSYIISSGRISSDMYQVQAVVIYKLGQQMREHLE